MLRVPLKADLADGTYVGTWRVVSADGHAITGSALFAVGVTVDPTAVNGLSARTDPTWEVIGAIARFVTYTAALLAAGLGFFLAFLHDQRRDRWKMVPVVRIASLVGLFGILASIATQAALATGRGLDAATDLDVIRSVLTETLGWSAVVLLLGLALVHLSTDTNRLLVAQGCAFYGGLAVSLSFVLWGHATEAPYRWLSVVSDGTHVAAAAVWFGGLVGLAMVLRRRADRLSGASAPSPDDDLDATPTATGEATSPGGLALGTPPEVTVAVTERRDLLRSTALVIGRFSTAAAVSVVALLLSGIAMTWIQSGGSATALWSTTYGRLVLTKMLLVVVVLALAAHNRQRLVPALVAVAANDGEGPDGADVPEPDPTITKPGADDDPVTTQGWQRLRRNVLAEIAILVAVLGVTGVLVNVIPARTAAEIADSVVTLSAPADENTVELVVTPARAGVNTLRVQYRNAAGDPIDIASSLRVQFTLPSAQLGPINRDVVKLGPGTFVVQGSELSIPGEWDITLIVRPSDFREIRTPFTVTIR